MRFRPWKPKNSDVYVCFYREDGGGDYIGKQGERVVVKAGSEAGRQEIVVFLRSQGIDIGQVNGIRDMHQKLEEHGLLIKPRGARRSKTAPGNFYGSTTQKSANFSFRDASSEQLHADSESLNVGKVKFKASTVKNAVVAIDHREPLGIYNGLQNTGLNVFRTNLPDGDILIQDQLDDTRLLLIERKTITDMYASVTGNDHHAHEQAERYYALASEYAEKGVQLTVIWIVEGENQGSRLLYNTFPLIQSMDGWLNYTGIILGQQTFQSYSMNHTNNLIAYFVQGFIERSLARPVKVNNIRIDKSKKERESMISHALHENGDSSHGVIQAKHGLEHMLQILPGINSKVASNLAASGKSFAEIVNLSEAELLEFHGVGAKTAATIFQAFNAKKQSN